jgi:hypothetical protein
MATGLIGRLLRRHSTKARSRGRILRAFARKAGLVYFGTVDQHIDEHEVIRGLTVSTSHQDDHYAVGSFDGYDVSLVDRFDIVVDSKGSTVEHSWVILQLTLERVDLPHIFLKPVNHGSGAYDKFFTAFTHLKPVNSLFQGAHSDEFHGRYELFASSSSALEIENTFTPLATKTIATRLWPHAVEIFDGKLYVYTTQVHLTSTLLETCLESALWLAKTLDQTEED